MWRWENCYLKKKEYAPTIQIHNYVKENIKISTQKCWLKKKEEWQSLGDELTTFTVSNPPKFTHRQNTYIGNIANFTAIFVIYFYS